MVRCRNDYDCTQSLLLAPFGKHRTLVFAPGYVPRDQFDVIDTERRKLSDRACSRTLIMDAAADEFLFGGGIGRVGENCDSRGNTAMNEIGGLEHPGAAGIDCQDDGIGRSDGITGARLFPLTRLLIGCSFRLLRLGRMPLVEPGLPRHPYGLRTKIPEVSQ